MAQPDFYARWPKDASTDYVDARKELLGAEFKLRSDIERVAEMRRNLPAGAALKPYTFEEASVNAQLDGRTETLHDLVKDRSLVVYHLMYSGEKKNACPSCSMWIDGFNGVTQHLAQHVNFVVVAKAPPAQLQELGRRRGWNNVRLLSSHNSTFNVDLNMEHPEWMPELDQAPGISVFHRDGDEVRHVYTSTPEFTRDLARGMDLLNPVWNVLDIIPEGRGNWNPGNDYIKENPIS